MIYKRGKRWTGYLGRLVTLYAAWHVVQGDRLRRRWLRQVDSFVAEYVEPGGVIEVR